MIGPRTVVQWTISLSFLIGPGFTCAQRPNSGVEAKQDDKAATTSGNKKITTKGWITNEKDAAKNVAELKKECSGPCAVVKDKKAFFVNGVNNDQQGWTIQNAETLKGHEGHFVEITGTLDKDTTTMRIEKVVNLACGSRFCERKCKGKCGNGSACDCE